MFETAKIAGSAWRECMQMYNTAKKTARRERETAEAKKRHPSN